MNTSMSKNGVWLRGALTALAAVCAFLLASDDYRAMVGPRGVVITGVLSVLSLNVRAFVDQSVSRGQSADVPVTVAIAPGHSMPVHEVRVPPAQDAVAVAADETQTNGENT